MDVIKYTDIIELTEIKQLKLGLFCALQVKHLMKDERSLNALIKLDLYIKGEISLAEIKTAAAAAYTAADSAYAAAYIAADSAYAAAAAADSAYAAAADAAYASSVNKEIQQKQIAYFLSLKNEVE